MSVAEIRDELVLEIDQALRSINQIEASLDRALAPIEIEVDTGNVEQLESTLREVERIAERASTETSAIALAAGKAEVNFEDMARALNISEDEARKLTREVLEAQSAANRLEDASRDVARQLGLSDTEANRLVRSLKDADRAAEAIDVTTIGVGQRFAALRSSAAAIAATLAGLGGTAILGAALVGANSAIQSFARLEDSINAVRVVFGAAAAGVLAFGETAAASAGLSAEAFNQAVVPIGSLLQNFGFDAQEASEGAVVLVQRAADLASVMGGSVQDALLAVGAALRGEADPLERYGASISAARVEQFALAEGLAATKAQLTPALLLQARYGLILSDTARVAGDFSNTSGDLANAQRSAGAAVQNFVTDIGEKLAPALENILVLLPEMLEGLRQLVPGFANAADSAAAFFTAMGEGGGFREEAASARAFFNSLTIGPGLAVEAGHAIAGLGKDILNLDTQFTESSEAMIRGGTLIERAFTQSIGVKLAAQLDKGVDAVEAFEEAIASTASGSSSLAVFTGNFRDFSIAANLSELQLKDVTEGLLENAAALGFNSEEVAFLTTILAQLNSLLFTDIEAVRQFNAETRALGERGLNTVTSTFTTFTSAIEGEIARLPSFVVDAEEGAAKIGEALDPFDDAAERIDVSAREFFNNLVAQVEQQAEAQANIARLIALGFDDVAAEIAKAGPGANRAAEQFLANLDLAEKAERLLEGEGTAISRQIGDELTAELGSTTFSSEIETAFISAINGGIFTNSQVEAAILDGSRIAANTTITAFRDQLEAEGAAFDASFLAASVGAAIGASLDFSDQAAAAAAATVNAYQDAFKDEFEISSPSKVMMRLGEEVVAGFLQGADMGDLKLRTPDIGVTGTATSAISGVASGGGINVNLTTVNPIQQDEVSDVARMGQIASSIAASYRSVVPNGM